MLLVLRRRLVEGGFGGALLVQQRAGVEDRLRHAAGQGPEPGAGREQSARASSAVAPAFAGQRDLRQPVGDGDADLGAGGMQIAPRPRGYRGAARPVCDGRLTGKSCGNCSEARSNFCAGRIAREAADQRREQIALLRQLLLQRRQRRLGLRQRRLLRRDVGPGDLAQRLLAAQDVERLAVRSRRSPRSPRSGRAATPPAPPRRRRSRSGSDRSASSWKRCASACAASDSTCRRVPPNTSGT